VWPNIDFEWNTEAAAPADHPRDGGQGVRRERFIRR
jgi:hypothetical protein